MVFYPWIQPGMAAGLWVFLALISVWAVIWKGIALWKCGRNNQLAWFVVLLILNTAGILPIIYLLFFQKKAKVVAAKPVAAKVVKKKKR